MSIPDKYVHDNFDFEEDEAEYIRQQYNFERAGGYGGSASNPVVQPLKQDWLSIIGHIQLQTPSEAELTPAMKAAKMENKQIVQRALRQQRKKSQKQQKRDFFCFPTPAGVAYVSFWKNSANTVEDEADRRLDMVLNDRRWQVVREAVFSGRISRMGRDRKSVV